MFTAAHPQAPISCVVSQTHHAKNPEEVLSTSPGDVSLSAVQFTGLLAFLSLNASSGKILTTSQRSLGEFFSTKYCNLKNL